MNFMITCKVSEMLGPWENFVTCTSPNTQISAENTWHKNDELYRGRENNRNPNKGTKGKSLKTPIWAIYYKSLP